MLNIYVSRHLYSIYSCVNSLSTSSKIISFFFKFVHAMDFYAAYCGQIRTFIILLFFAVDQTLLTNNNAGFVKKEGSSFRNRVTFSPNNPFLSNPLMNVNYQGNPFLSSSSTPLFQQSSIGNNNGLVNLFVPGKNNGPINPFLPGNSNTIVDVVVLDTNTGSFQSFSTQNTDNNKNDPINYSHNPFLIPSVEISNKNDNIPPKIQNEKKKDEASISIVSIDVIDNKNKSTTSPISVSGQNENHSALPNRESNKTNTFEKHQNPTLPIPSIIIGFPNRENIRTKSDLKCEEYSKQVSKTTETISLVGTNTQVIKVPNDKCTTPDRLIIGGTIATPGEFPHIVALGKLIEKYFVYECVGTLISPLWVLTAAHCTHGPDGGPSVAKFGLHNIKDNQSGSLIPIERTIRHPSYKSPAMYADIALIKLQNIVAFNDFVKPACLYQFYDNVPMKAWVTGWGVTELAGEQSDELRKAQLDIIDNIACSIRHNKSISVPYGVTPSMICAGDPRGGWNKDTCQGDSGGPLQVPHPKYFCLFQIIGITSFGEGCAIVDTPGVYTRVSHYLNWIEDIVWPDE